MTLTTVARNTALAAVLVLTGAGCPIYLPETTTSTLTTSGPNTPQTCGQSPSTAFYGNAALGATVVLGVHRMVNGDANWTEGMGVFVGQSAVITELGGTDAQGCPGVRVSADGGEWFWRIRDMTVVAGGSGPVATAPDPSGIPQMCGMDASNPFYGPIQYGTSIVLGRHRPVGGDPNWGPGMDPWVGQVAVVTQMAGTDAQGCPGVRVSVDGGEWFWRIRDVSLASAPPQACGQSPEGAYYGPVRPGSVVVLGRHRPVGGDDNWTGDMNVYVGQAARVLNPSGTDAQGCPGVRVDIDGGEWFWRIRDMQVVQ